MLVLIAFCAALYVAVLLPFKILVIMPGLIEVRPGAVVPVVMSFFFGPAATWGAAFGNTIGDFLGGTIGPGSLFGFFGNFLYGFVPYRIMRAYAREAAIFSGKWWLSFVLGVFLSSGICAVVISIGLVLIKAVPEFSLPMHIIFINNFGVSLLLGPILIRALDKRVTGMRLKYDQVLESHQISQPLLGFAGSVLLLAFLIILYVGMMIPSLTPFGTQNAGSFQVWGSTLLIILPILLL